MNIPSAAVPFSVSLAPLDRKKRVLLIDASSHKRDLRADVMRKLGMDVDCAADIIEARCWWKANLYDLVLVDVHKGRGQRDEFCEAVRGAKPPQRLAFFVGRPGYLADVPSENETFPVADTNPQLLIGEAKAALSADLNQQPQRWGILEASRRISAVRRASDVRAQALRDLPPLPRDPEGLASKRSTPTTLDDLLREEMQ